ncbi:hypothetical protein R1flu_015143 [Riccia fluitans]|uniref:Uncharacterized protein n=1 Tax=Riccia fluitans TaxID=41844 RepID=A0ABD1YLW1_9MARC
MRGRSCPEEKQEAQWQRNAARRLGNPLPRPVAKIERVEKPEYPFSLLLWLPSAGVITIRRVSPRPHQTGLVKLVKNFFIYLRVFQQLKDFTPFRRGSRPALQRGVVFAPSPEGRQELKDPLLRDVDTDWASKHQHQHQRLCGKCKKEGS